MSLIKAIKQQLGLSVTPANNFTWSAAADDGTMKLARGNAGATTQDIMTVNALGKVAFPANLNGAISVSPPLLAAIVSGQTYINNTGSIKILYVYLGNAGASATMTVDGFVFAQIATPAGSGISATYFVPAGAEYSCVFTGPNTTFTEQTITIDNPEGSIIDGSINAPGIGVGQTWQNMTGVGGRALGAAITNNTGRPIYVSVRGSMGATSGLTLTIDGIVMAGFGTGGVNTSLGGYLAGIVPAGSVYTVSATGTGAISLWAELR